MKKSIIVVSLFFALAAIAFVYAVQNFGAGTILPANTTVTGNPVISAVDPFTVPTPGAASSTNVKFEWKLGNPYLLKNGDGRVFVDLRVTGKPQSNVQRKPMNLVLVIDRSGSMGSENKLEQVKEAARQIIANMNPTDRLGIVIYDDSVSTLVPSTLVENKDRLLELVASLSPGGSTNLYGGLEQGFAEAKKNFRKDTVNRIVLLSDGLANAGISDPTEIGKEAQRVRESSISISAMGVGVDYNENLMANIADNSGGNYYYISTDMNMAEIFRKEWNLMQSVVGTDAVATLQLEPGIAVQDIAGFQWNQQGRTVRIQVPDIYSGETKRILVELSAPADKLRTVSLAKGQFVCTDITGKTPVAFAANFDPAIKVIEDQHLVAVNLDREVNSKAASNQASKKMEEAYKLYEGGEADKAYKLAADTTEQLQALGYTANEAQVQRYNSNLKNMAPASAPEPSSVQAKDFLKRQKEAERKAQQNTPQ